MVDWQLVAYDRRVDAGVDVAHALAVVVLSIHGQAAGVKAGPLGGTHIHLEDNHAGATVNRQVRVVYGGRGEQVGAKVMLNPVHSKINNQS